MYWTELNARFFLFFFLPFHRAMHIECVFGVVLCVAIYWNRPKFIRIRSKRSNTGPIQMQRFLFFSFIYLYFSVWFVAFTKSHKPQSVIRIRSNVRRSYPHIMPKLYMCSDSYSLHFSIFHIRFGMLHCWPLCPTNTRMMMHYSLEPIGHYQSCEYVKLAMHKIRIKKERNK